EALSARDRRPQDDRHVRRAPAPAGSRPRARGLCRRSGDLRSARRPRRVDLRRAPPLSERHSLRRRQRRRRRRRRPHEPARRGARPHAVTREDRRALLWVVGGAAVMVGVDLGRRILTTNDEARFPLLAQDILTRGDWLFPILNGSVYHNKPILLAWLIALVSWPLGYVTQLTAVIPSAAAAFAMALVVFGLGREMFGAQAGVYAALTALTTQGFFLHARIPMPDMLMTAFVTASLWMLWRIARGAPRAWIGFYICVGLAFWAKGPGGFMPLIVASAWAAANRNAT